MSAVGAIPRSSVAGGTTGAYSGVVLQPDGTFGSVSAIFASGGSGVTLAWDGTANYYAALEMATGNVIGELVTAAGAVVEEARRTDSS